MKLPEEDAKLFYKLYHPLLVYVNKKSNVVTGINSIGDIKKSPIEEINKIKNKLYEHSELIDSFVQENPPQFSSNELRLIGSWKNFVKGRFYILHYLKNYTIFLDEYKIPKAYGVLAHNNSFEEMVGPYLPVFVEAVLLPFNDKITYDGLIVSYPFTFGSGIRKSLNSAYQEAKSRFGIITSLPFEPKKAEQSDADRLRFYLRSEYNRERYWEEICKLIKNNSALLRDYHQEMGKIHARRYRKQLREIGFTNAWFAIVDGVTVASGSRRDDVERILQSILPAEKREFAYIFQLKSKQ